MDLLKDNPATVKPMVRRKKPTPSSRKVYNATFLAKENILPIDSSGNDSAIASLNFKDPFLPNAKKIKVAIVMYPIPPIWIQMSIIALPMGVKKWAVSLTISPVTHMAEVTVKSASIMDRCPLWVTGMRSSSVPRRIIPMYPYKSQRKGLYSFSNLGLLLRWSLHISFRWKTNH